MNIYRLYTTNGYIDRLYNESIDMETGIVSDDFEERLMKALNDQQENREDAINEIKSAKATVDLLKKEKENITKRIESLTNYMETVKKALQYSLDGEKFDCTSGKVYYRASKRTIVDDEFINWALESERNDLLRFKAPEADLTKIKEAIEIGENLEFARLENNTSMIVK